MTETMHLYLQWVRFWTWTPLHTMKELPGAWTIYNLYTEHAALRRHCDTQKQRLDELERRFIHGGY